MSLRAALAAVPLLLGLPSPAPAAAEAEPALPTFETVRAAHRASDVPLLAHDGTPLGRVRLQATARRGPWLALHEVSPALRQALVLGEDRRFWQHAGVDWQALAASAWANVWDTRTRGASTLTMQLAGLLDHQLARPAGGRSLGTKVSQIVRARQLEAAWSKSQILETYLNAVPLRGELVGVAAASEQLFGKHARALDTHEAALLAALVRGPNAAAEVVQRRACELLRLQGEPCDGLAITWAQALARRPGPAAGEALAPHLGAWLARRVPGATVPAALPTTLDAPLQRLALATLRQQLAELNGRNVEDGAVVVLDNASGAVRAWVGSVGPASQAAQVDAVLARRQPGSTLKPFVYGLALDARLVTAASTLDDSPLQLDAGGGQYQPRNYDHHFRGAVPLRQALGGSLNVPAVRVARLLGAETLFDGLQRAGLRLERDAGFHGHALALGSADVTLLDLANAYRALAQGGLWRPWHVQATDEPPAEPARRVLSPEAAWLVADMLADPAARAATFGLDSALVTRGWAAVKTGTSKDLRDNWAVGFTRTHTVAVWVGNASGAPMHGVSGTHGAAPVWRALVQHLHGLVPRPAEAPPRPPALVARHGEWFLPGTEPLQPARDRVAHMGIRRPADGAIVVLDPGIPRAAQRLVFEGGEPAVAGGPAPRWWLNGQPVPGGARPSWEPRPGRHVLELRGPEGTHRIGFEVRVAPPRPAPG